MYLTLKLLHLLAVIAFVGNVVAGLFWFTQAVRTGQAGIVGHAMAGLNRNDRLLTFYGGIVLFLSGAAMTWLGGYPLGRSPWIWAGLGLFLGSGALFHAFGAPVRRRLLEMASTGTLDPAACVPLVRCYQVTVAVIILLLVLATMVMVFKPA